MKHPALTSWLVLALVTSISSIGQHALPALASNEAHATKSHMVTLLPLNNSGVSGTASVMLHDKTLTVSFDAKGLQPNMVHAAHIHGMLNGTDATCPTMAQDINGDGYVSVFEGLPKYGPIKVSLTNPITPPGPNTVAALFAPFAGKVSSNFQGADGAGMDNYSQSITYDLSDSETQAAYQGIMPLRAQEIVIHGAMAPESVDTAGGSSKVVYDGLLPIACGDLRNAMIENTSAKDEPSMGNGGEDMKDMKDMPDMDMTQEDASTNQKLSGDQQISHLYEVRNATIDRLNRAGDVVARDKYLKKADEIIQKFTDIVHLH
jgi:hypothetical protein